MSDKAKPKPKVPAVGTVRRKRGTGGAIFQVIGKIGQKLIGKDKGFDDDYRS